MITFIRNILKSSNHTKRSKDDSFEDIKMKKKRSSPKKLEKGSCGFDICGLDCGLISLLQQFVGRGNYFCFFCGNDGVSIDFCVEDYAGDQRGFIRGVRAANNQLKGRRKRI
jgi:hypothetical protein